MEFAHERIIVTGGASGIGRATVIRLAELGGRVAVVDQNFDAALAVAEEVGNDSFALQTDVSHAKQVEGTVATAVERMGGLDVLCNNAGFGIAGSILDTSEDDWDRIMNVNLKSVFLCSKFAIPALSESGEGRIVNTSSYTAAVGIADRAAYVASKGAISALTRAMALDHAAANIRVNAVAPGTVDSPYFSTMIEESPDPNSLRERLNGRSPLGRMGRPEEIAEAIVWLASRRSSFATGSVLTIDGGSSTW